MSKQDALTYLESLGCEITPCGSRVTCSNPRPEADEDYLVFVPCEVTNEFMSTLAQAGFHWEGNVHYRDAAQTFMSWRNPDGNVNLIISQSAQFIADHKKATAVCKRLDVADKNDRIAVFQGLLYGNWDWQPAPSPSTSALKVET